MIYMAICEDQQVQREHFQLLLEEYARKRQLACKIDAYPDGYAFLSAKQTYDLLFLDIMMPDISGIEVGALLRKRNQWTKIIYITGHETFALSAYDTHPFDYLLKPFDNEILFRKIDEALQSLQREKRLPRSEKLVFASRSQTICLRSEEIYHIEAKPNHMLHIHTKGTPYNIRLTLAEAMQIVANAAFAQPHRGFLVNLAHVKYLQGQTVVLQNGVSIPVAAGRLPEFKAILRAYWAEYRCK